MTTEKSADLLCTVRVATGNPVQTQCSGGATPGQQGGGRRLGEFIDVMGGEFDSFFNGPIDHRL